MYLPFQCRISKIVICRGGICCNLFFLSLELFSALLQGFRDDLPELCLNRCGVSYD